MIWTYKRALLFSLCGWQDVEIQSLANFFCCLQARLDAVREQLKRTRPALCNANRRQLVSKLVFLSPVNRRGLPQCWQTEDNSSGRSMFSVRVISCCGLLYNNDVNASVKLPIFPMNQCLGLRKFCYEHPFNIIAGTSRFARNSWMQAAFLLCYVLRIGEIMVTLCFPSWVHGVTKGIEFSSWFPVYQQRCK